MYVNVTLGWRIAGGSQDPHYCELKTPVSLLIFDRATCVVIDVWSDGIIMHAILSSLLEELSSQSRHLQSIPGSQALTEHSRSPQLGRHSTHRPQEENPVPKLGTGVPPSRVESPRTLQNVSSPTHFFLAIPRESFRSCMGPWHTPTHHPGDLLNTTPRDPYPIWVHTPMGPHTPLRATLHLLQCVPTSTCSSSSPSAPPRRAGCACPPPWV